MIVIVLIALVAAGVGAGVALYLVYPTQVEVAAGAAWLLGGVVVALVAAYIFAVVMHLHVLDRWLASPLLLLLPLAGDHWPRRRQGVAAS
jgi:hypothetical protein